MSSMVVIRCPVTNNAVDSGILTTRAAFRVLRTKDVDVRCPACGALHCWQEIDAWLSRINYPLAGTQPKESKDMVSKRELSEPHKEDRRYVRRDEKGRFKTEVNVGRPLAADRRRKAKLQ